MPTYVALLRGINVGGHRRVAMSDLRDLLEQLGFVDVQSLLQSGNLVFRSTARTTSSLERVLETQSEKVLALKTDFLVRSAKEWKSIIVRNPFREVAERDPAHLVVMLLKDAPAAKDVKALDAAIAGSELIRIDGRQAYVVYPSGIGRSRLTNALIERKLRTRATGRNWNSVLKLDALAGGDVAASGRRPRTRRS